MGINIKELGLTEEKVVRETIKTPQGLIEVYEPSADDVVYIIELQQQVTGDMNMAEVDTITFDGREVLTRLFPILTNIDMSDIAGDELDKIISNPSIHLLIAQQYVAQIISEINLLYVEQMKTKLKEAENTMSMVQLMNDIPMAIMESAKQNGKYTELVENVERLTKEVDEAILKEKETTEEESKVVIG